jgi:hypothetical protein
MKKLLFFAFLSLNLCFITGNQVSAQNKQPYQPLVVENAHWEVGFYSTENPIWAPYQMYQYLICGDSILNGQQYKKLFYRDLDDADPEHILSEEFYGLMREDTLNRKVYAINSYNYYNECPINDEFLLYDFDLEVGDTTDMCLLSQWGQWIIYDINYETIFNKERRLFYQFNNSWEYIIEGVGSNYGLLEWGNFTKKNESGSKGAYFELMNYCNGTDEECGYLWVGIEEREESVKLKVTPNPAKEIVNFEFGNIQNLQQAQLRCYDVFGSLLHSEAIVQGQKEVVLDISSWPSGMYVAVVYSNGGVVGRSKFVVE